MIVARGSDEPQYPPQIPGYGDLGRVVDRIKQRINDSDAYAVVYPAASAVSQNPYQVESIRQGSEAARKAIMDYATECPGHKIALLGYSQVCPLLKYYYSLTSLGAHNTLAGCSSHRQFYLWRSRRLDERHRYRL